jgi:hypothetical protein
MLLRARDGLQRPRFKLQGAQMAACTRTEANACKKDKQSYFLKMLHVELRAAHWCSASVC